MEPYVPSYCLLVVVGIAVAAKMRAGVVCTYIPTGEAVAFASRILLGRRIKGAAVGLYPEISEVCSFKT